MSFSSYFARLAKICAPASQAYVERILFCMGAAPFWTMKRYVQLSPDESLSKTQSDKVLKESSCPQTVFGRLVVNDTDLCDSLAERTDTVTDSCLMVNEK